MVLFQFHWGPDFPDFPLAQTRASSLQMLGVIPFMWLWPCVHNIPSDLSCTVTYTDLLSVYRGYSSLAIGIVKDLSARRDFPAYFHALTFSVWKSKQIHTDSPSILACFHYNEWLEELRLFFFFFFTHNRFLKCTLFRFYLTVFFGLGLFYVFLI